MGSLSLEEVKRIPSIADEIAAALRREEFSEIIDEKIPDSIGNLVAPLKGTVLDQLNEANELLAQDLLDSIDHIVKKLAVKSLAFIKTLSIALNELNNIYRPKAYKSLKKSAGKLGDETGPLIIRILQVICQIIITKISVSYGIDPITANTASVAIVFGGKLKDILNILKFFSKSQH